MNRSYLVTNITINANEKFECDLPTVYSDNGMLTNNWLRVYALNALDVEFDYEPIIYSHMTYTTEHKNDQPYFIDIVDTTYDDHVTIEALPLVKNACTITIDEEQLEIAGDVKQAIFENLIFSLQLDFLVRYA